MLLMTTFLRPFENQLRPQLSLSPHPLILRQSSFLPLCWWFWWGYSWFVLLHSLLGSREVDIHLTPSFYPRALASGPFHQWVSESPASLYHTGHSSERRR